MSAKSKSSPSRKSLSRPFPKEIQKQARALAEQYQVIVSHEEGHWYGRGLELPYVFGDGKTAQACIEDTRQALAATVATLIEAGQKPPAPAREGTRTMQVNVRLFAEEKAMLEAVAARKGFSGLSDFIRAAAIDAAG